MRVQEALEVLKGLKGWQDPDTVYLAGKFLGAYELAETFKDGSRFHEARYAARSAMDDLGRLTALKLGEIAEACRVIERELSAYELLPDVSGSRKINRSAGDVSGPEKYPVGSMVKIASPDVLQRFMRPDWQYHHPLQAEQLHLADAMARVTDVGYYHGGDVLYVLSILPGYYWHEECLG